MKKKVLAAILSLSMVLNTFSVAGAAEFEFTDGEIAESVELEDVVLEEQIAEEAERFDDGAVVAENNEVDVAEIDIPPEPEVEIVKIGDNVTATITYVYIEDYGSYYKTPSEVVVSGTGDTWGYLNDGNDDTTGTHQNPFKNKSFTKIQIESGITSIGDYLFAESEIQEIVIPEGVVSVGKYAFSGCRSLGSVALPKSVSEIGQSAFEWCRQLKTFSHHGTLEIIPPSAFYMCTQLKEFNFTGVKEIGNSAFYWTTLSEVKFTNDLKEIETDAFSRCENIQLLSLPDSLIKIGNGAFGDCIGLITLELPNTALELYNVFSGCIGLQKVLSEHWV